MALRLAIMEGLLLFVSFAAARLLWVRPLLDWRDVAGGVGQALVVAACCSIAFYYNDFYDLRIVRSFRAFVTRLLQSLGFAMILLAGFYGLFPEGRIASDALVLSFIVVAGLLVTLRGLLYSILGRRPFVERIVILGGSPLAHKLVVEIEDSPRYVLAAVVAEGDGGPADLAEVIARARPHRVVVALAERRGRLPVRDLLEARMRGVAVEDGIDLYERLSGKLAIEALNPSYLIFSSHFKTSRVARAGGRVISLVVAAVGLVACAPLLALIAIAIKLDSRGPVLFVHDRVGRFGTSFGLIKFRTMHPREEATSEWVRDNAHRVTRVGQVLRKFRLDELPQFVNMLRGDLNLVGPRPHPVSNFELFLREIPYYWLRSMVRPGITGWAQIRYGYANDLAEETEKMRYDLYFIKHLSLHLHLRILVDTLKIVMFGRGATEANVYQPLPGARGASAL